MNRKLGEVFEFIGYRLRVEESKKNDCEGCFFYEHNIDCIHKYSVTSKCINVIFKEIKEDMKVLLFSCVFLILCSCTNNAVEFRGHNGTIYRIDTLTIHGNRHEFIVSDYRRRFNGFIHSPECWCLNKEVNENN